MRRTVIVPLALCALLLVAAPAAAHNLEVDPKGEGTTRHRWVGGGPVPGQGGALLWSPMGTLPPAHANGLPNACGATSANPSAVTFLAPPFGSCHHGQP